MKIVQINTTYGSGNSTGRTTMEMHRWLSEHGYESYVFCTQSDEGYSKDVMKFSGHIDQRSHALLSRITGMQGSFSIVSTTILIKRIKTIEPDFVLLRVLHSNNINLSLLFNFLSKNRKKTIIVLHDFWYMTGHCMYPIRYNCHNWLSVCGKCPSIKNDNISWFFDTSKQCFRKKEALIRAIEHLYVVGVSDWITKEARKSPILQGAIEITRIYNWVNMEVFRPKDANALRERYGVKKNQPMLLAVSTIWGKTKGLDVINRIHYYLPNVEIYVIGKVMDEDKKDKKIHYIGLIDDTNSLADYYSMADVFVNPSIHETFGKTTAEAMCCGTPVVCFNTSACVELVDKSRGEVVSLMDENALVEGIKNVLIKGKTFYFESCIEYCKEKFFIDENIKEYLNLV